MTSVYARTREREKAWKFGMYCLLGSIIIAPVWYLIFKDMVIGHSGILEVHPLLPYPITLLAPLPLTQ
jgi:ER lumen protein retaining receptor